ncbi:MAG: LptF/LptG family permease [Candidatus Neomarinimicrobiota bacterium]|nr:LptF/LptG family permease [Candidatus Neomarinimicrobiota bacterium]
MKRIDTYVIRQFISLLGTSLLGFIVIFLVVDAVENIDKFIDAEVPKAIIAVYYFHSIPWFISIGLPMAVLVSTIFTVGLLSRRNELTAMKASGVSLYRIAMPLIVCSIIISGGSFFFEDQVVTTGNQKRRAIEKDYLIKSRSRGYSSKNQEIFLRKSDIFHIAIDRYRPKTRKATGVVIHFMDDGKLTKRIDARTMTWKEKEEKWWLNTYAIRQFHPDGFETAVHFSRRDTLLAIDFYPDDLTKRAISPQEKNYLDLKSFIAELNENGVDTTRWKVNLYGKISFAFTNVIVVLFSFPLVAFKPKTGLAFGAGMSVFVIFGYYAFIRFGQTLGYKGILEPVLSAWIGNIIFSIGGIILLIRARK